MSYDVFLSYRRSDQHIARTIVEELETRGISVWWDQKIDGGEDWRDAIVAGLEASDSLVILFSDECNASKQLKKELAIADLRDMLVVPVLIEDTQPKGHYLYELASRNWIQIFPNAAERAGKLADKLSTTLGNAGLHTPAAPAAGAAPTAAVSETTAPQAPASTGTAPRKAKVKREKPAKKSNKNLRDFLPLKWIDVIPVGAGIVGIYMLLEGTIDLDYPLEAAGQLVGLGALVLAAYGAIVFPIRYFMRRRRVMRAAIMYALSSIVLLALFFGGLVAYWEGDVSYAMDDGLIGAFIWAVMGVFAIIIYAVLSGIRAVRSFRKNVEVL